MVHKLIAIYKVYFILQMKRNIGVSSIWNFIRTEGFLAVLPDRKSFKLLEFLKTRPSFPAVPKVPMALSIPGVSCCHYADILPWRPPPIHPRQMRDKVVLRNAKWRKRFSCIPLYNSLFYKKFYCDKNPLTLKEETKAKTIKKNSLCLRFYVSSVHYLYVYWCLPFISS